jgi:leucyl-tRNA---protein transferase
VGKTSEPGMQSVRGVIVDCGPCPYLANRNFHAFQPLPNQPLPSYRHLMDARFRRSGDFLYAPACTGCQACQPLRVDVAAFTQKRDQRRCAQRNADLTITMEPRGYDAERADIYTRYQRVVHDHEAEPQSANFLVDDGGIVGGELHARDGSGKLLAVSVVDIFEDALSSVYCYYDPDHARRSLGTYLALAEIAWCQSHHLRWLYLGFYVADSPKMNYKARFGPYELLIDGEWQRFT